MSMSKAGRIVIIAALALVFVAAVLWKEAHRGSPEATVPAGGSSMHLAEGNSQDPDKGTPIASSDQDETAPAPGTRREATARLERPGRTADRATSQAATGNLAALPRLVDLGSNKCVPCKMMAPLLEELKTEYRGRLLVEVIDVREDQAAARSYGIRVIPTQVFFDPAGQERFRHEGFMSKKAILSKWRELGIDLTGSDHQGEERR